MRLKFFVLSLTILFFLIILTLSAVIIFGGPISPKMPTENRIEANPFASMDVTDLPPLKHYSARDGESLAYRFYPSILPDKNQTIVLLPGSSADSSAWHSFSRSLAQAGLTVYTLDVRGHGGSGHKGRIEYIGQLEDDLEDFIQTVQPGNPRSLVGFSASGGFALRFAGSSRQMLFDRYLLLSPTVAGDTDPAIFKFDGEAKDSKKGGWVSVGVPRLIALHILNHFGIKWLNNLNVISFALNDDAKKYMTTFYSYSLAENFNTLEDYRSNIQSVRQKITLIAGEKDELIYTERYQALFKNAGHPIPITIVPNVGHVGMIFDRNSIAAIASELLNENGIIRQ